MDCAEARKEITAAPSPLVQAELPQEAMVHIRTCASCTAFLDRAVSDENAVLTGGLAE